MTSHSLYLSFVPSPGPSLTFPLLLTVQCVWEDGVLGKVKRMEGGWKKERGHTHLELPVGVQHQLTLKHSQPEKQDLPG